MRLKEKYDYYFGILIYPYVRGNPNFFRANYTQKDIFFLC